MRMIPDAMRQSRKIGILEERFQSQESGILA